MGRYLIRRALFMVLVLWVVSVLTFLIFFKLPQGNPAIRAVGQTRTPRIVHQIEERLGLNKPIWVQYARFAKGLIPWPGFFLNEQVYYSWANFVPVKEVMYDRLPVTVMLAIGAGVLWIVMGFAIGILSAIRRKTLADRAGMLFALLGVSLPDFWLAYVALFVFWFKLRLTPGTGIPAHMNVLEAAAHGYFILPWLVLSSTFAGFYVRMVRGNLIETMTEDYIRTGRAKGLSERRVIFRHGLRAALTPTVTMFGMDIGYLLGGAVITETVFNLHGVGAYAIESLTRNDFPGTMGVTVLGAFFIVVANLVVDVAYAFLDPRVRYT